MKKRRERPYWLAGGTELCHVCTASYVLEMEIRCVGCDRGICVQCVVLVRETLETFCPECTPEAA